MACGDTTGCATCDDGPAPVRGGRCVEAPFSTATTALRPKRRRGARTRGRSVGGGEDRVVRPPLFDDRERPWLASEPPYAPASGEREGERATAAASPSTPSSRPPTRRPGRSSATTRASISCERRFLQRGTEREREVAAAARRRGLTPRRPRRRLPRCSDPFDGEGERCECDCRCETPPDGYGIFQFVGPPSIAPWIFDSNVRRTPQLTLVAIEATTNVVALESVAMGSASVLTRAGVSSQLATTPFGRATGPATSGVSTGPVVPTGSTASSSGSIHPPVNSVAGAGDPGAVGGAAYAGLARDLIDPAPPGFPDGAYVNPRPMDFDAGQGTPNATPTSDSPASGRIDRGAGDGSFVNVRPDFGMGPSGVGVGAGAASGPRVPREPNDPVPSPPLSKPSCPT